MLAPQSRIKIVATILARNEEDIIAKTIEHHLNHGVSQIIFTDNNSTDGTRQIAEKYPEVEIIDEPGDDHHQSLWVTRMAREACKMNPDWIVHLDADEFWCGLSNLRKVQGSTVGCTKMFLHPPGQNQSHYLSFENIKWLPGECKVAHRPDPEITITHGNHGFEGINTDVFTKDIWRHHFPIRSYKQLEQKTVLGHRSLSKRNAICERWHGWYKLWENGDLHAVYCSLCNAWDGYLKKHNMKDLKTLLKFWSTPEVIQELEDKNALPNTGRWPSAPSLNQSSYCKNHRMI